MPINYEFDLWPSLLPACQYMFFISHIYPTWYHWRNLSGAWLSQAGQKKAESRAKAKVTICTLSNSGENITKKSPFSICIFLRALTFKKYAFYTVKCRFFAYFLENHWFLEFLCWFPFLGTGTFTKNLHFTL